MQGFGKELKTFWGYIAFGLGVSLALLLCLAEFKEEIAEPLIRGLDASIMQAFHVDATPALTHLMETLTWIGSPAVVSPVLLIAVVILWMRSLRREALLLAIAVGGGGLLDTALKLHFRRIRPDVSWAILHEHSFSFPSGHSVVAVALYGMLLYLVLRHLHAAWQKTLAVLAAFALATGIGLSRIYLGVHFPSDVAAGYFVGAVWVLAVIAADWKWARAQRTAPGSTQARQAMPLPGSSA